MPNFRHITLGLFILIATNASAQLIDSIAESFQYPPKLLIKLDTRNSFITSSFARIRGIKVGVDYNKTTKVGLGFSWLATDFYSNIEVKEEGVATVYRARLSYEYFAPYFEYAFYKHNNWEVSIPVQLGIGRSGYRYRDANEKKQIAGRKAMVLYEPAMTAQYRFLKYFGVGAGIGYRLMLVGNDNIDENFNSPIYILKAKVFFGDIYNDVFKRE